jgi:hypothetical protein
MTANGQWVNIDLLQGFKAAVGANVSGATVKRTFLWVLPHAVTSGDAWWVGVRVSDLDDISTVPITTASIPNPSANPYVAWRFAQKFELDSSNFGQGVAGQPNGGTWQGCVLDLRSRARLANIQETWGLTIFQDTVTTVSKQYDWYARTLLAMS